MRRVKIEPTVIKDRTIFVTGEFEVSYDYPNDVFAVKPCEERGGKIIRGLTENFYPRRNIMPQYELAYEKLSQIVFNAEVGNVAPVIKRLMKDGEEEVIDGIADHLVEMLSSQYAIIKYEDEINYDNEYKYKKPSKLRRSSIFGEEKLDTQENVRIVVEKFYTQEELDEFKEENFKDLYFHSNMKKRNRKEN